MYNLPEHVRSALCVELANARTFSQSTLVKTNEGRQLVTRLIRLMEILVDGQAATDQVATHNP